MANCAHQDCNQNSVGQSKYCRTHKAEARQAWKTMITQQSIEREERYAVFEALYAKAHKAGVEAALECQPTPMIVQQHADVLDDSSPVVQQWVARGGVCGSASVTVTPGTTSFARWAVANRGWHKHYYGGVAKHMNPPEEAICFDRRLVQSLEIALAYTRAFVKVLNDAGINAHCNYRED